MEMKNKLFHHHKSKFSIVMRNFSLSCLAIFGVVGAVTVPTYISIHQSQKSEMKASEVEEPNPEENVGEETELESYE
jgi:hypothetical protein